ncbi:MAG TPA: L-fucose/L-arabinose isomerase family protein [Victivallales bacterium]|nr:L-fucose/L-arabinose isomerase family protein [Victivallales bacterium]HRU00286.1 L-fucose/L-arabinose isomerase family protein [Victivallales bacterium]
MIPRIKKLYAKIGVLGVGHQVYWNQFDGLLEEMHRKQNVLIEKLKLNKVDTINLGLIDNAKSAYAKIPEIKSSDIDVLFIDMCTYATSSVIGIIFKEINIPIVMIALQPLKAMDYQNGTTFMQLCNDDICSMPEFAGVALRIGRKIPDVIIGTENNDPKTEYEIAEWCSIAKVIHDLKRARIGLMGHVLEAMLDMHTDPTAITATFGSHVVQCEPDDLMKHWKKVQKNDVNIMKKRILDFFDTPNPISDPITCKLTENDLKISAEIAVALENFIKEKELDGLAYYYEGEENSEMRTLVTNLIVGNSLLTSSGFPMCGEFDIKTCIAMMIMDRLEIGGSFAELHPIDFEKDTILIGHDGPHHLNIADRKPVIRSLKKYHGKPGKGASVEFNIKTGPITILSIGVNHSGKFRFVIAEGESIPGPIPPTGNTNTHGKFKPDVRTFLKNWIKAGPTHHFALGIGHYAKTIAKIAELLDIENIIVT